jgi:AcrR family transcriptional regulator
MNKTKRKIFEASMKLFADKGYEGTSIEEITSEVGVAKGTLYYHFSSKEEIFNFLINEGMSLLENSIQIKIDKQENYLDKIRAIALIQVKIVFKYEKFITILFTEVWGSSDRALACQKYVNEYLEIVEKIIDEGIKRGEIKKVNSKLTSKEILGFLTSSLYLKKTNSNLTIEDVFKSIDKDFLIGLKN